MDYKLLNAVVDESGLKRQHIAAEMGISPQRMSVLLQGRMAWKMNEVCAFCKLLNLTKKQRDDIFFGAM